MNSQDEILSGRRFGFGENWSRFLVVLTQERIDKAERGSLIGRLRDHEKRNRVYEDNMAIIYTRMQPI